MTRKLLKLRNTIITLLIIESAVLFGFYMLFNSSTLLTFAMYSLAKNIVLFIGLLYFNYLEEQNNVSVTEALNNDAKNAFIFGGIGLIQYDENRNIVWTSDLFKELRINIVGIKLLEWQPHLASLFEDEDIKIIDIKGRKFEAYNSIESKLIYIKDVTQYLSLQQDYFDQQVCMAYITIDNYEETLENADEPKAAAIQGKCRQVIVDWAYSNGIILRSFKSGGYIAFFNERIYRKQVENKFAILDTFKEMSKELDEVMTLSIGIGRDSRVLRELEDMASSALSLTYSRGGDQVAIKSGDDNNVRFFGGDSESFEKSSKVRARVIAHSLANLIKNSVDVYVMGHKNTDLDSLGACLGIARIAQAYGKNTKIILDFDSIEQKTKNVATIMKGHNKYKGLIMSPFDAMEHVTKSTLLIVVDTHKPSMVVSQALLEKTKNKVVIDHHRRGEEFIASPVLTYLEPAASSAVELVVEISEYQNVDLKISELDATILYAGMLIDTNYFRQRVGVRTFQSAAVLRDLQANVNQAYEFIEDSYKETLEKLSIAQRAYQYNNAILIALADENQECNRTMLAKASNALLEINGIKASFTIGYISKNVVGISARSSKDINVQVVMENLGGGGHFSMAAAQFENHTIEQVRVLLEDALKNYLDGRGDK